MRINRTTRPFLRPPLAVPGARPAEGGEEAWKTDPKRFPSNDLIDYLVLKGPPPRVGFEKRQRQPTPVSNVGKKNSVYAGFESLSHDVWLNIKDHLSVAQLIRHLDSLMAEPIMVATEDEALALRAEGYGHVEVTEIVDGRAIVAPPLPRVPQADRMRHFVAVLGSAAQGGNKGAGVLGGSPSIEGDPMRDKLQKVATAFGYATFDAWAEPAAMLKSLINEAQTSDDVESLMGTMPDSRGNGGFGVSGLPEEQHNDLRYLVLLGVAHRLN